MNNSTIRLRDREEIADKRINEVVAEIEGHFYSGNRNRMLIPISDGLFSFSKEGLEKIARRIKQPNLFGYKFQLNVVNLALDSEWGTDYLEIKRAVA